MRLLEGRFARARRLVRRIGRRVPVVRPSLAWASIASVWVHLGWVALGLWGFPSFRPMRATFGPPAPYAVVRLSPVRPEAVNPGPGLRPPAPVRPAPHAELLRFARTDERDALDTPPEQVDVISAHHTRAEVPTRAPVTSDRDGLPTPVSDGDADLPGAPTFDRADGDPEARLGNRPVPSADRFATRGGGGGGGGGTAAGVGAPGRGDGVGEAGPAPGAAAGAQPSAVVHPSDGSTTRGVPVGPDPSRIADAAPPWWDPIAVRVEWAPVAPGPALAELRQGTVPSDGRAPVERPGAASHTGGVAQPMALDVALPTEPADDAGTRRVAAPGTADPVDELREALGFGPLDRTKLAPRPEWAGRLYETGMADSSPQTALATAEISFRTAVSAEGTALGSYVQRAEAAILTRWRERDLDPHSRALGLQGDVTVRYLVHPDGRTSDVTVVRSSGNAAIDQLAVGAIPPRLARFPRELDRKPFVHEVTLGYRNPLIGP